MTVTIDYDRVRQILDESPAVDGYTSYYRQYLAKHRVICPLVPDTKQLLQDAFAPSMHVVDVGCGRGDTLLDSAHLFRQGTGIDESVDIMLAAAGEEKTRRGIRNVEFRFGKGNSLPFADDSVDLVFSERGPLGHSDPNLVEALRVLRPGGLIFIETGAELTSWETAVAFNPEAKKSQTCTKVLDSERDRFERHGVPILALASRIRTMQFPDFYEWLRYQCYTWCFPPRDRLSVDCRDEFEKLIRIAGDRAGHINITHHTIWIAGKKPGQQWTRADGEDRAAQP